ncbi:hypothetical protein ACXR2U_08530 [Jatrophihabitans sp. YIM 134969]
MTAVVARHRAPAAGPVGRARLLVVVGDQAVNSITNVVVVLVVAAAAPLRDFGIFAAVAVAVQLTQSMSAAGTGDRLLQAAPESRDARYAAGARVLDLATISGAAIAVVGWLAWTPDPWLVALALAPALTRVDYWRVRTVAHGNASNALLVDVTLGALQAGGVVVWWRAGAPWGVAGATAAWAAASLLVAGVLAVRERRPAGTPRAPVFEAVSVRYGLEIAAVNGSGQIAQLLVTTQLGFAFSGTLRAAQVPFGIVVVLVLALRAVLIPPMRAADEADARRLAWVAAAGAVVAAAAFTVVTLIATAVDPLRFLVGGVHLQTSFVVVLGFSYAAVGAGMVQTYYLRARHRDREVSVGRAVMLVVLAAGTAAALITRSSWVFLAALALSWSAASLAMAVVRPTSDVFEVPAPAR